MRDLGFTQDTASSLSLVANELEMAAGYTMKNSYSGSSPVTVGIKHVDPELMTVARFAIALPTGSTPAASTFRSPATSPGCWAFLFCLVASCALGVARRRLCPGRRGAGATTG